MKCDKYYDITCIKCGRSLSTDFDSGMTRTARQAHLIAKEVGFNSRGICPICIKECGTKKKVKMNRLLPCPKCNDSWLFASEYDYGSDYENFGYHGTCKCDQFDKQVTWNKTKEQAIEEWNLLIRGRSK